MVSVVSGGGLGVLNSSRFTVGGELGQASQGRAGDRITVNAANGNLVIQNQDGQLAGIGADIALLRTYNSQGGWDGDNGDAWRLGYYRRISGLTGTLNAAGSSVKRTDADGLESTYTWRDGRYVSTDGAGAYDSLVVVGSTATWTDGDTGVTETYVESTPGTWRLTQITDPDGHALKLAYDAQGLIASLSTWKAGAASADETLTLAYDAARRLTQLSTTTRRADGSLATQTRTTYTHDSAGRLSGVVTDLSPEDNSTADGRTYTVAYTYDSAGRVRTVTQTDGTALTIAYDASGRVSQLTDALGRITTFSYDSTSRQTTVTDALNQSARLSYDSAGRLIDLSGTGLKTSLAYDADGNVLSSTNGLGQQTQFAYDGQGNLIRSTDATGRVLERSYDAANRQTSQTQSAQTTRYVYDTTGGLRRLRFTISAEGRVSEQQYNSLGQLSSSLAYTRSPYTGAATLADLTAWASQQTVPQRTDYSYDLRGQLSSRTDASGLTRYTFDAFGRLLQSIDASGNTTAFVYDGLDRLTLSTDALGASTVTSYDDAGNRTSVQLANGLRTVSTYNTAGLLIAVAQFSGSTALGETRYTYDAANRLRMTQDPTGQRQWLLYDEAGRVVGNVDALGHLTETRYDAAGRAMQSIGYEQPVNTALLLDAQGNPANVSIATVRPGTAAGDRRQWQIYDAAGRLTHQITSLGEITETQYDGTGRVSTVVQHGQRLSALPAPGSNDLPTLAYAAGDPDRITRNLYDADGLLRGTLDAEGYLTEMRYDAAGRLVERVAYATATDAAQRSTGTLAQLIPAAHSSDRRSVWLYDAQGRIQAEIDPDGTLTESTYNAAGQRTQSLRYARRITGSASSTSTLASLRPAASTEDHGTRWTYDTLARVQTETAADGTVTRYGYDNVGNLTSTERAVGTAEVRSHNARYDVQGRLTAELSAEGAAKLANAGTQEQIDAVWASYATRHAYDAAGRRIRSTDARGSTTVFYYDAAGRQVYRILKSPVGGEVQASRYTGFGETALSVSYTRRLSVADTAALTGGPADATLDSKIATLADSSDQRTQASYTQRGLIQQAIDALGFKTDTTYNAFGQVRRTDAAAGSTVGDGRVLRTEYTYDRRGLHTATAQDPQSLNLQTRAEYDAFGRQTASVDARGYRSSTQYLANDGGGRQVVPTDASGARSTTVYDAFDRVVRRTDALGYSISFTHDTANRRVTMTDALGIQTVTESTRHGQVAMVTDGTGASTTYRYDKNGNLLSRTDALGNVTSSSYDAADNLVAQSNPGTAVTRFTYDAANRLLTRQVDPDGLNLRTAYEYDGQGRAVKVTDAAGTVTSYRFDAKGELTETVVDDAATGLKIRTTTAYDAQGQALSVTEGAGTAAAKTTEYRYDLLGRRIQEIVDPAGLGLTTAYEYDAAGNVVSRRDAAGAVMRFKYDAAGRKIADVDAAGAITEYTYDAAGRVTKTTQYATTTKNLLGNDNFLAGTQGFAAYSPDPSSISFGNNYDNYWHVTGQGTLWLRQVNNAQLNNTADAVIYSTVTTTPISPGQRYYVSAKVGVHRASAALRVIFLNDAGQFVGSFLQPSGGQADIGYEEATGGPSLAGYKLLSGYVTAPPGATQIRVQLNKSATVPGGHDSFLFVASMTAQAANPLSDNPADWRPVPSVNDRVTYFKYDAAGRKIADVDAAGAITEYTYDAAGRVTKTTQYATTTKNLLGNDNFLAGTQGFAAYSPDPSSISFGNNYDNYWHVTGQGTLWLRQVNNAQLNNAADAVIYSTVTTTPISPGQRYYVSAKVGVHRASAALRVIFLNDAGQFVGSFLQPSGGVADIGYEEATGGPSLAGYKLLSGYVTAPPGATQIRVQVNKSATVPGGHDSFLFVASMTAQAANPLSDNPVDWRPVSSVNDRVTYFKYDAAGRKIADIDAAGAVTEYTYDAAGRITKTTQYATATKNLLGNDNFLAGTQGFAAYSPDPSSISFGNNYDNYWHVTGQGTLWLRQVNNAQLNNTADGVIYSTVTTTPISPGQRYYVSAKVGVHRASAALRVVFLNDAGQFVGSFLQPSGGVADIGYEEATGGPSLAGYKLLSGYVTAPYGATQIRVQVNKSATVPGGHDSFLFVASMTAQAANPLSDNPADWRPVPGVNDRVTYFKYDAAGRKIAEIDAAGAITEYTYDAAGRVTKTTQYANTAQNLLGNDNFLSGTQGFAAYSPDPSSISFGNNYDNYWHVTGQGTLWLRQVNNAQLNNTADAVIYSTVTTTPISPGQRYYVSAKVGVHRASAALRVIFLNDAGQFVGSFLQPSGSVADIGYEEATGGPSLAGYKLLSGYVTAPPGATQIRVQVNKSATVPGGHDSFLFVASMTAQAANPLSDSPADWRPVPRLNDRVTRYVYDPTGRPIYQQDPLGYVTKTRYTPTGQPIEQIRYATPIPTTTAATQAAFDAALALTPDATFDRPTRYIYNNSGQLRFTIDALGGVVESVYDAFGQVARSIAYDTPIAYTSVTDTSTPESVRALLPASTLAARETLYTHDSLGRLVHTAQSVSSTATTKTFTVTQNHYDAQGRLTRTVAYSTPIPLQDLPPAPTPQHLADKLAPLANPAADRSTQTIYDAAGRIIQSTDGEGYSEQTVYDAWGNKARFTNKNGAVFDYEYDRLGRLLAEWSPPVAVTRLDGALNPIADPSTTGPQRIQTRLSYDAWGRLLSRTEAYGRPEARTTRYEYDALGRQVRTLFEPVAVYDASTDNLNTNGISGAPVSRTETAPRTLATETVYNAFGQAVAHRDVSGNTSYKTYDKLGRLVNEVDANHNVTQHLYSARDGEYSQIARLGTAAVFTDGLAVSADTIDAAAAVAATAAGGTRNLRSFYDRLGRTQRVEDLLDAVYSFDSATSQGGNWVRATTYGYTVWGDLKTKSSLLDRAGLAGGSNRSATTYFAYDLKGALSRQVDAEGYVTDYVKNAFGEDSQVTEYASKIDIATQGIAAQPTRSPGRDRTTAFAYDRRGLQTRSSRLALQAGVLSGTPQPTPQLARQLGDLVNTTVYDGTGNAIRMTSEWRDPNTGATLGEQSATYQFYDLMGRLVALVAAEGHDSSRGRITATRYDALGNAVLTRRYASLSPGNGQLPAESADDQVTRQVFDRLGRVLQVRDALGNDQFFSYDAAGHVAKQWTPFADADGLARNAIQTFSYDKLGRQTDTKTLVSRLRTDANVFSTETALYNAFGEIIAKARDGITVEQNWYDNAGRLWKTNAGDGVFKIHWYDLQDNVSASFVSNSTALDLASVAAPDALAALPASQLRRTSNTYDRLQHVLRQQAPSVTHLDNTVTSNVTTQGFDAWGNVLAVFRNGTERVRYRYNSQNQVIEETQVNATAWSASGTSTTANLTKSIYYDAWGHNIGNIDAGGTANAANYDFFGQIQREYHADGGQVGYAYDHFGRLRAKTDEVGRTTLFNYDRANRETSRQVDVDAVGAGTAPYQLSQSTYDALGRKITETTGRDSATWGAERKYWYDPRGLLVRSQAPGGQVTNYWYDEAGRKTRERDGNGLDVTWGYDRSTGRLNAHTDLGGATYSYTYANDGQLLTQVSSRGQSLGYTYDGNGALRQISDGYLRSSTQYDHDADGNRIREIFTSDGVVYRDLTNAYDNEGRLVRATDKAAGVRQSSGILYELNIGYDAAGNRRRVWGSAQSSYGSSGTQAFDDWYTYDAMNRVRINGGDLVAGAVSEVGASVYVYDMAGRRRQEVWKYSNTTGVTGTRLEFSYDFADRLVQRDKVFLGSGYADGVRNQEKTIDYSGNGAQTETVNVYDYVTNVNYKSTRTLTLFNSNAQVTRRLDYVTGKATTSSSGNTTAVAEQVTGDQATTYDAAGNVSTLTVKGYGAQTGSMTDRQVRLTYEASNSSYQYSYVLMEGYKERGQYLTGQSRPYNGAWTAYVPSQSVLEYDANGNLVQVKRQANGGWTARWNLTDNAGHITRNWGSQIAYWGGAAATFSQDGSLKSWTPATGAVQGTAGVLATLPTAPGVSDSTSWSVTTTLYVNDQHMGQFYRSHYSEYDAETRRTLVDDDWGAGFDVAGLGSAKKAEGSGQTYTAQAGDTARSLAQRFYGDAALWYIIADANALGARTIDGNSDAALTDGQVVKIPNVVRATNTATSFAVYDPSGIIGDTSPEVTMPPPPPPPSSGGGCGGLGMILVIVVAVVVTVVTAGAAAVAMGAVASGTGVVAAGTAVLTGGLAGATLTASALTVAGAAAVGGAVGSIASQGVAMAMGMQDKFSWKQVGLGAIGAAVTSGMGQAGMFNSLAKMGEYGRYAATAASAATSNAITQGLAVVTDQQEHFNWRAVATSAMAAPVAQYLGGQVGSAVNGMVGGSAGQFAGEFAQRLTAGVVSQRIRMAVYNEGKLDYASIAADAFGQVLGQGLADAMNSPDQSAAETARLNRYENAAIEQAAANNRTALNAANRAADPDYYGPAWNGGPAWAATRALGQGANDPAIALANFDAVAGRVWTQEDAQADLNARAALVRQHEGADVYRAAARQAHWDSLRAGAWSERTAAAPLFTDDNLDLGKYQMRLSAPQEPLAQLRGGAMGVLDTFAASANGTVRLLGNMAFQGIDMATGGYFHDTSFMRQVWAEQEMVGQGMMRLATDPRAVATGVLEHLDAQYTLGAQLHAQGNDFGASRVNAGMASEIAAGVFGVGQATGSLARFGAAGLREVGVKDWNVVFNDVPKLRGQAGAVGVGLEPLGNAESLASTATRPVPRVDVSDRFVKAPRSDGGFNFDYGDPTTHGLQASISKNGTLSMDVRANTALAATQGSGTDMAASLMNRLASEGIEVNSFAAQWIKGSKDVSVNYSYYNSMRYKVGDLDAARGTWTGQFFAKYGFDIVTPPVIVNSPGKIYLASFVKVPQ